MTIRKARPEECARLSALAWRSKARWGYAPADMERWRDDLTLTPRLLERAHVFVADDDGTARGWIAMLPLDEPALWSVEHFWVDDGAEGRGLGRALWDAGVQVAVDGGAATIRIESDPNAEGFYRHMGAVRVGELPAPAEGHPGRVLPVLSASVGTAGPTARSTAGAGEGADGSPNARPGSTRRTAG